MRFKCGKCSKTLSVPDSLAGKVGKCPGCASNIRIPNLTSNIQESSHALADTPVDKSPYPGKVSPKPSETPQISVKTPPPKPSPQPKIKPVKTEEDPLMVTIREYKKNVEKAIRQRDEAMEMIDQMFQFFSEQANNPKFQPKERKYYQEIATRLFQLQSKFPLLLGLVELLDHCEMRIFGKSSNA